MEAEILQWKSLKLGAAILHEQTMTGVSGPADANVEGRTQRQTVPWNWNGNACHSISGPFECKCHRARRHVSLKGHF